MDNSTVNNLIGDYTDNPSYEDYKNYQLDDLFCFRCSTKVFYEIHDIGRDSGSERGIPYPYVCLDCDENMEWEEAIEWMDYNVCGSWVGDKTPIFIRCDPTLDGTIKKEKCEN